MDFIKHNSHKLFITLLLLLLGLFSTNKFFDDYGKQYTDEGFQRALVSFAIGKGLNSAISIVQGTEVALEPAGVGVVLTPGQILDPANDLIERFSLVMLVCSIVLGIQSILLLIFSSFSFMLLVGISLLLMAVFLWRDQSIPVVYKNVVFRLSIFILILRFFIPVMAVASEGLYKAYLQPMYDVSTQQLEYSDNTISKISKESSQLNQDESLSWYQLMTKNIESAIDALDVNQRIDNLTIEVEKLTNNVIDLIVIFVLQTILFPLLFLWLTLKLIKANFSFQYFK